VAVKVIRTDLADHAHFRVRFRREVAAARKVSGPFAATVVDADMAGPLPWLATAYVAGPSLTEAVYDHGPLPVASVLALAAGLAAGLGAIHAARVVHRDLKPSNVLLARDGPRVIDFGISRATEAASLTRSGTVMGSPGFMSPEQAEGREVGPASDMFSLGAVLTFAATGECPFGTGPAVAPAPAPALARRASAKPAGPSPVVTPTTPPPSPTTVSVVVAASGGWADTGIQLGTGDSVTISASGSWAAAGQAVTGPDGYAQPGADNYFNVADLGACATCASTQAPHWGALISYTGTSPPPAGSYTSAAVAPQAARIALAGSQSTSVSAYPGEFWLAFNDDAYSGSTAGNSGQVTVTITVTRA